VLPQNMLYINKEFLDFDFLQNYKDLDALVKFYKSNLQPKGKVFLFIDEIQNIEQWERFVNSYAQDFSEEYEVFISGSNSKMLSGELATLLSGRYVSFEIQPFSFVEFVGVTNLPLNKDSFLKYLQGGGLPELFMLPNEETKRHYVSSIKDTVLLRDIIQRHAIKDPTLLEDLFVYIVNNASNLLSVNNIANYLKSKGRRTTYDTVANYIGYIEDAFLVHRAVRYDIRGKETLGGSAKFYANDLSYKNYLYSGFGYGLGYLLENLVYLELRRKGYEVYAGVIPGKEIDFVAKQADKTIYVQVAYLLHDETTLEREYSALDAVSDHYPKMVVSLDEFQLPLKDGIQHVRAWELGEIL
jgi:predicted AAA+ superfamily ATPase